MTVVGLLIAAPPLFDLLRTTRSREYYSHIPLIAVVSAYLLFRRRREIFRGIASAHPLGIISFLAGIGLLFFRSVFSHGLAEFATTSVTSALFIWWGSYLVLYGKNASQRALFPFLFLIFAVPMPVPIIEGIISALVFFSTYMTRLLFFVLGVPFVQEGPVFFLPGFDIEVAQQCSGIRSSLALLVTTVVAGHLFLKRLWKQALLALAVFPVAIVKNAIRIVTLYLLSYFIDIRIIEGGFLHKSGGFIFFGLGLLMQSLMLLALKRCKAP